MVIKSDIVVYINMHGNINSSVYAYDGRYYGNILFNCHAFICMAIKSDIIVYMIKMKNKYLLISVYTDMPNDKLGKNCTDEFTLLKFK